ncbi:hypothetical protein LXL04_009302 [Taraxacum kok-saghyz]
MVSEDLRVATWFHRVWLDGCSGMTGCCRAFPDGVRTNTARDQVCPGNLVQAFYRTPGVRSSWSMFKGYIQIRYPNLVKIIAIPKAYKHTVRHKHRSKEKKQTFTPVNFKRKPTFNRPMFETGTYNKQTKIKPNKCVKDLASPITDPIAEIKKTSDRRIQKPFFRSTAVNEAALSDFRGIFQNRPLKKGTFIFLSWLDSSVVKSQESSDLKT